MNLESTASEGRRSETKVQATQTGLLNLAPPTLDRGSRDAKRAAPSTDAPLTRRTRSTGDIQRDLTWRCLVLVRQRRVSSSHVRTQSRVLDRASKNPVE